jgi:cytochrome c-type biogenesis protein
MHDITLSAVFLAGFISFLTPCVLPLVPAYLSYMAGMSVETVVRAEGHARARVLGAAVCFVLGFGTVFVTLGATASVFGGLIRAYLDVFTTLAAVAIILMGLHFLGVFKLGLFYREARFTSAKPAGMAGSYVMGLAFGFGWTPCIGPVLAAVLTIAAQETTVSKGAGLLALYAAGLGVPFIAAAGALSLFQKFYTRFRPWLGVVERAMGAMLILVGIAFLMGWMSRFSFWLLETFPMLGRLG